MNDTPSVVLPASYAQPTPPLPPLFDTAMQPHSPSCSLEEEIMQLDEEYNEIESLVLETIKEHNISHKTMLKWFQVLPLTLKEPFSQMLLTQARELSRASNVDELFMILCRYWNSQHPTLLEYLIRKLNDENLNVKMKHYMEHLRNFRLHTTLGNFIDKWMRGTPPGFNEYVLKLGEGWRDKTLEDFNQFVIGLSRQKSFERQFVYLSNVTTGCLAVVIAVPQSCSPLKPDSELLHYLQENMVLSVLTGGECILNLEANKGSHEESASSGNLYIESINKITTGIGNNCA